MGKQGDIISKMVNSFQTKKSVHDMTSSHLEEELFERLQEKETALEEIIHKFEIIEENKLSQFLTVEKEFQEASEVIQSNYIDLFKALEVDERNLSLEIQSATMSEDTTFDQVIHSIFDLKNEAYQQFQIMVKASNEAIDDEMRVHTEFIASETSKYDQIQKNYQRMQTEQSNNLLWTIEQSKNALTELTAELTTKSENETGFINESILSILNTLRSTKSKISSLFKSTTDVYTKQRDRIFQLSSQRQKPHSVVNQTIIHQYVKQIKDVNQKKVRFERLILSELKTSKEIIGQKIIEADKANDRELTQRYILQYEIIQKKAEYLLKRNQSMADLLISKHQNEIKKIKIDSFKRVEEIKLAYLMPAMFFQNSINLYSNFSFYVNESFDDLDNLLSDLIIFNTRFSEAKINYISKDAKTIEDYRLNLMVRVSNVCSSLTELISKIDHFSKEIITLESQNHLEIAEVRKQMENAEIKGDYDKYIRSVENDHFFAVSQHEANRARITSRFDKDASYIRIQREVALLRQNYELFHAKVAYLKEITKIEEDIHQISFEKDLETSRAKFFYNTQLNDTKYLMTMEAMKSEANRMIYLYAAKYLDEESNYKARKESGSDEVVDFIHHSQNLIDFNHDQTEQIMTEVETNSTSRTYAYYLEYNRSQILKAYDEQLQNKTKLNQKATQLIHHPFFVAKAEIENILDQFLLLFKQRLLLLDISNIDVLKPYFLDNDLFGYAMLKAFNRVEETIESLLSEFNHVEIKNKFSVFYEIALEKTIINIHETTNALQKARPKKQVQALNAFLIEEILILRQYLQSTFSLLDDTEEFLLENDVLFIRKAEEKAQIAKKMINHEYDRLIYYAVKSDKNRNKQKKQLLHDAEKVEDTFRNEVRRINQIYLASIDKESDQLAFMKKQITKLIYQSEAKLNKDISILQKAYQSEQHSLHLKIHQFEKAYQQIMFVLNGNLEEEFNMIDQMEMREKNHLQTSLSMLDNEMVSIPIKYDNQLQLLEDNKIALIEEKKITLLSEYTKIEETKFSSRPALLAEIEEIKKRLPTNYLDMYQHISKAEEEFLNQYLNISTDYSQDFQAFLTHQKDSRTLLEDPDFMYHPFQSFVALEDTLLEKNTVAFQDTLSKAKALKDHVQSEESKSQDKQKRIIND